MTRTRLNQICAAIRAYKARSDKLASIRAKIEELRDEAKLPTTRALYQAVLDMFD